jgi:hypothetical protein
MLRTGLLNYVSAQVLEQSLKCDDARTCLEKAVLTPGLATDQRFSELLSGKIVGLSKGSFVKAKRCLVMAMLGGLVELCSREPVQ